MTHHLHPAYRILIGVGIVFLVYVAYSGAVLLGQKSNLDEQAQLIAGIRAEQLRGKERSFILRATAGCEDIINDQEIEITTECTDPNVAAYFPPSICKKLPVVVEGCGSKAKVITRNGD